LNIILKMDLKIVKQSKPAKNYYAIGGPFQSGIPNTPKVKN